jgi:hypothetical protein
MTEDERDRAFRRARLQAITGRTALLRGTRDEIVRLLRQALGDINVILAGQPTDYQSWILPQIAREIRRALGEFGDAAAGEISSAAARAWDLGQDLVDKPLAAAEVRIAGALPHIDTRQLSAMRAFMTDRIRDIGLAAANRINSELGLVVIGAQSPSDAIGKVRAILGEASRTRATTIVRTELGRVFSVASFERLKQAAARVPGLKKQWRKSGKLHPRFFHELADGQVRDVGEPFHLGNGAKLMFPHDPAASASETINCGCVMLPSKSDWRVARPGRAPGGRLEGGQSIRELLGDAA